jgi:hypothetical protein
VQKAEIEMKDALIKIIKKHDLTAIEIVRILLFEAGSWSKYALRAERHPRNPNKKGDEA